MASKGTKNLPKALADEELRRLLERPNIASTIGLRDRVMLEVMARAGLRVSEVVALRRAEIAWGSAGELTVVHVIEGKGGKDRNVTVTERTGQWLRQWDRVRYSHAPSFFHTCAGRNGGAVSSEKHTALSVRTVQEMVKGHAHRAGLPSWVTPHKLRNTYATWLIDQGTPTAVVQRLLGHARIATTEVYLGIADPHTTEAVRRISQQEADQQSLDSQAGAEDLALARAIAELPASAKRALAEAVGLAGGTEGEAP